MKQLGWRALLLVVLATAGAPGVGRASVGAARAVAAGSGTVAKGTAPTAAAPAVAPPAGTAAAGTAATGMATTGMVTRYPFDRNHSTIGFAASILKVSKVTGKFADFKGAISAVDPNDPTTISVDVTIQAASIDTGIGDRDNDLRGRGFFDTAKYPEITFKSKAVRKAGADYLLDGVFTMHGVTKELSIPFKLHELGKFAAAEAHLTLNRQDYGITWSRKMDDGSLFVADEVEVDLYMLTRVGAPYQPGTPVLEPIKN